MLKFKVEDVNQVEEALRPLYKERDGAWFLEVEGVEDTTGLKSALKKERDARAKLEADIKRYAGIDPEKVRELQEELDLLKTKDVDRDKYKEMVANAVKRATDPLSKELEEAKRLLGEKGGKLSLMLLKDAVVKSVSKVGSAHESALEKLLLPEAAQNFVVKDDGSIEGTSTFNSLDDWAASIKETFPYVFQAPKPGGSGSTGNAGGMSGGKVTITRDQAKNPAAYRAARAEAEKAGVELQIVG